MARQDQEEDGRGEVARGAAVLVAAGVLLGLGYNALGLAGNSTRGLPWIAVDKVAAMPSLEALPPAQEPIVAPPPDVPIIPDLPTPIQVQLPAVKKLWDARAALIVDARTPEEYAEGHIAGAVNLSYDLAVTDPPRLEALDSGGRPVVVYCGGGTCEISISLAEALMYQAGKKRVVVFMGGYPEWQAAGYPVATGGGD